MSHAVTPWDPPVATGPVTATVRLPGSKSMTARALVLGALATGPSTLRHPLRARDTELMASGLRGLGVQVDTSGDPTWRLRSGPLTGPAHVDVGLAGTVMRFLPGVAGLASGPVSFDGDPQARVRPLGPLVGALRAAGMAIDASPTGGLPLTVHGTGRVAGGEVTIDASGSSQFVSGLLLAAAAFDKGLTVRHVGAPVPSAPHLRMTAAMLRAVGVAVDDSTPHLWTVEPGTIAGHDWDIEPDLSGAAPFLAAALVTGGTVTVPGWPSETTQPGDQLRTLLGAMGGRCTLDTAGLTVAGTGRIHGLDADLSEVSELTMVLAALAALADSPSRFTGIAHIRGHETDRLGALTRELTALGAEVAELPDGLAIKPRPLHDGPFHTYDDHRMAHAGAVLGLAVPGIRLSDVSCVSKTMPDFTERWASMVRGDGD